MILCTSGKGCGGAEAKFAASVKQPNHSTSTRRMHLLLGVIRHHSIYGSIASRCGLLLVIFHEFAWD